MRRSNQAQSMELNVLDDDKQILLECKTNLDIYRPHYARPTCSRNGTSDLGAMTLANCVNNKDTKEANCLHLIPNDKLKDHTQFGISAKHAVYSSLPEQIKKARFRNDGASNL
eukprot:scaffold528002_cov51-Attheya_sp.AAC.1